MGSVLQSFGVPASQLVGEIKVIRHCLQHQSTFELQASCESLDACPLISMLWLLKHIKHAQLCEVVNRQSQNKTTN